MSSDQHIDILILQTALFGEASEVLAAIETVNDISTDVINLQPELMGDTDWDAVINRVLRAGKVITL